MRLIKTKINNPARTLLAFGGLCLTLGIGAGTANAHAETTGAEASVFAHGPLLAVNRPDRCYRWQDCYDDDDDGGNNGGGNGDGGDYDGGVLPPVDSVERAGPFSTTIDRSTGPSRDGWVGRPTNLGQDGIKHPVFIWGPGAGTGPEDYEFFLDRMASHGFVVFSEVSSSGGREMTEALDWLEEENSRPSSPYYQKLDLDRIAAGGHSRGSIATFAIGSDPRLKTTVHVAGGSFDGQGSRSLRNPALYVGGTEDFATSNAERDYQVTTVPVFFTILDGVDHIMAARSAMPVITAWLRWQLADEERRSQFISPNCTFCGGQYDSEYKNW